MSVTAPSVRRHVGRSGSRTRLGSSGDLSVSLPEGSHRKYGNQFSVLQDLLLTVTPSSPLPCRPSPDRHLPRPSGRRFSSTFGVNEGVEVFSTPKPSLPGTGPRVCKGKEKERWVQTLSPS